MSPEFENILNLLESGDSENIRLAFLLAKNHEAEFEIHFKAKIGEYEELITFLIRNNEWNFQIPFNKIEGLNFNTRVLVEVPASVRLLYSLENLNLGSNWFQTFPVEIMGLRNLKCLDLSYNQLQFLPKEIEQLHSLEELKLKNNQLKTLPKELRNLTNCKIYVNGNHDLILPKELQGWENIIM
ncbi:MAG: hypothetical protein MUC49_06990 [Raineya sp.]|jgi:Leucine-rich repeat (LRR) protein|nr:hypothetical protein [Raineya sp.]